MKVSVCMIAYNQEKYIAEAINSILLQKVTFQLELIISDDCSSDNTLTIIKDFHRKFQNKIKIIERNKNIGMMPNFISTLEKCDGKYIAICEGDDYWLDPFKLQKQVDFLDSNPEYAICFHRVYELSGRDFSIAPNNRWDEEQTFKIEDLACGNFINTLSVVYRNGLIKKFPVWFELSPVGDYVLHMLNARKGLIKYFPEIMGVYRMYSGTWSVKSTEIRLDKFINVLNYLLNEDFHPDVKKALQIQKQQLLSAYCRILLDKNDFSFIKKIESEINEESDFIKTLLIDIYPTKIASIYNSKTYKLAKVLSKIKNKIYHWK